MNEIGLEIEVVLTGWRIVGISRLRLEEKIFFPVEIPDVLKRNLLLGLLVLLVSSGTGCCRLYDRWFGQSDHCAPACSNPCSYGPRDHYGPDIHTEKTTNNDCR